MSFQDIINQLKNKNFRNIYWLEGEETYFIDQIISYAESNILSEEQISFNLSVFYGKDSNWTDIINACRRYPMFSDFQVVILKEAQTLNGIENLSAYVEAPLKSTIFLVAFKGKIYDNRTKLKKAAIKNGVLFESKKLVDFKIPELINDYVLSKKLSIQPKAVNLIFEHIGNDLNRIFNEIDKLIISLEGKSHINEDDIEQFIGISKEYNGFELQNALVNRNLAAAIKIINYFEKNPKAAGIHSIIPLFYSFVSKVYAAYSLTSRTEATLKPMFYFNANSTKQGITMMRNYSYSEIEKTILILNHYNLKSLGVGDSGNTDGSLLKEMVCKIIA